MLDRGGGVEKAAISWSGSSAAEDRVNSALIEWRQKTITKKTDGDMDTEWNTLERYHLRESGLSIEYINYEFDAEEQSESFIHETTQAIFWPIDSAQPTSGAVKVTGASGTYAEYTVVLNGFEVSINGAQAEFKPWPSQ